MANLTLMYEIPMQTDSEALQRVLDGPSSHVICGQMICRM